MALHAHTHTHTYSLVHPHTQMYSTYNNVGLSDPALFRQELKFVLPPYKPVVVYKLELNVHTKYIMHVIIINLSNGV